MRKTIDDLLLRVQARYDVATKIENGEPHFIFTDRDTGAVTSCDYSTVDFNMTVIELLGTA